MATSSMIPYSNPAGNNQTSPPVITSGGAPGVGSVGSIPTTNPVNPGQAATQNPLIPATATPGITSGSVLPGVAPAAGQGVVSGDAYNQLRDIYGAAGGTLTDFMNSISGTNSATLQEYIKSLQPQEAQADANLHASLGAGGVSANSSVAALGESNLQAQEFAAIAGESANLTQSQQNLEAHLIEGTLPDAAKQVADSNPLNIFGTVLGDIGSVVGDVMGLGGITGGLSSMFGGSSGSIPAGNAEIANYKANNGSEPGFTNWGNLG